MRTSVCARFSCCTYHQRGGSRVIRAASRKHVDETCPVSTEGWTRRVHFVREGGGGLFAAGGLGAEPPRSGVGVCGRFTALMSTRRARRHVQRPGGHVSSRPASVSGTLSSARTAPSATTNSSKSICEVSASAVPAPPASRFAPRKARIACKGGGGGAGLSAGGRQEGSWRLRLLLSAFGLQSDTQEEKQERGGTRGARTAR